MLLWHLFHALWWPEAGQGYAFTSSIGSDLTELTIIGAVWHKFNCHTKGCWRIGRQQVEGTTYVVCRKHHPSSKPTHEHILDAHAKAKQGS